MPGGDGPIGQRAKLCLLVDGSSAGLAAAAAALVESPNQSVDSGRTARTESRAARQSVLSSRTMLCETSSAAQLRTGCAGPDGASRSSATTRVAATQRRMAAVTQSGPWCVRRHPYCRSANAAPAPTATSQGDMRQKLMAGVSRPLSPERSEGPVSQILVSVSAAMPSRPGSLPDPDRGRRASAAVGC